VNPPELDYSAERFQVNVYKVYTDLKLILSDTKNENNPQVINLKDRLEELFAIFSEENGIDDDWSDYNKTRVGLIDNSNSMWYTWFVFELIGMKKTLMSSHLNHYYRQAEDQPIFISTMYNAIRTLSNIELDILEPKIEKISNWIDSKAIVHNLAIADDEKRIELTCSENEAYDYFKQLEDHKKLTATQIDRLIRANFEFGIKEKKTRLIIDIDKSHLSYFVKIFFKKYNWNDKNLINRTSKFLMLNFVMYDEELNNAEKLENFIKNLSKRRPKKYDFQE
jgi:hypothetical protein